jgi:cytoskeleton protein RodZ
MGAQPFEQSGPAGSPILLEKAAMAAAKNCSSWLVSQDVTAPREGTDGLWFDTPPTYSYDSAGIPSRLKWGVREVNQVGSFGEHLRREREMRGISLDEIMATTKIGRRLLLALEEEQFDLLPGGIFNKSYVRAYAKCVGMNEDEAVAEYLEAAQEPPPDTKVIAHQHAFHSDHRPESSGFPILPVLILLVVAIGAAGGWQIYHNHQRERDQQAAAQPANTATVAPSTSSSDSGAQTADATHPASLQAPQRTAGPAPSADKPSTATANETSASAGAAVVPTGGTSFEITIRPKDPAWVSVKCDGKFVVRGIIKPPDVKTIRATNEVIFYTGNAGEVEVAFNGKAVPLNSGANDQQTLVFDSRGVLARAAAQ